MRAVEKTQFRLFVSRHVIRNDDAGAGPVRAADGETVFQHPLHETLALHRPTILHTEHALNAFSERMRRCGGDAVHHRAGETCVILDPACEARIAEFRELAHGAGESRTVVGEVVATDEGERLRPCVASAPQTFDEVSDQTRRKLGCAQIALDVGVGCVESPFASRQ